MPYFVVSIGGKALTNSCPRGADILEAWEQQRVKLL